MERLKETYPAIMYMPNLFMIWVNNLRVRGKTGVRRYTERLVSIRFYLE